MPDFTNLKILFSFMSQLVRVGGIDIGILLSKAEDVGASPTAATHWLVSVEGPQDEEIVSEKALGRILETHDSDGSTIEKIVTKPAKKTAKTKNKLDERKQAMRKIIKTRAKSMGKGGNDGIDPQNDILNPIIREPPSRSKKKQDDESVVKVRMLTGTLFMYRGGTNHRRVKFVRTV